MDLWYSWEFIVIALAGFSMFRSFCHSEKGMKLSHFYCVLVQFLVSTWPSSHVKM